MHILYATYILFNFDSGLLQTGSGRPLAFLLQLKDAATMGLHLADLAREPVPRDSVERLPTHVAVGASVVRTREPSVLAFQVLEDVQTWLEREGEREGVREREEGRGRGVVKRGKE